MLMNNKLAIIGANEAITMLINKAKELGYETHVFAWKCGDPGEIAADFFYPISIDDKEAILQKCKEIGICGVCSITSDYAAPTVAYVARSLKLPGNPESTDVLARDKYEMRKAFIKHGGIYCPRFIEVSVNSNLEAFGDFSFPLIVKPTDRWSSKGVTRVDTIDKLKEAIDYACNESINGKAIVEEFMNGPEYSAECIVYNGHVSILAYTEKMTTGFPHYIEKGHKQPANLSKQKTEMIDCVVRKAIKALNIENSAAHVEFRILENDEIGIIEVGARMGGDCIGTDLTPISTGLDYIRMVIDVACGNPPCFDICSNPFPVQVVFCFSEEDIKTFYSFDSSRIIRKSDFIKQNDCITNSSDRWGYYIISL